MQEECCNINEVVQEYYNFLKSYIFGKVKNKTIAEDVVQEVMVKLIKSHEKSQKIDNIKAWLFQVSRNTIYDYYKNNNLEFNIEDNWDIADDSKSEFSKVLISDYIVPMIKLLPKDYSTPLYLSDIDKIPQKDISIQLNLTLSATKMRIQRGRVKLRELFTECCHLEYDKNGSLMGCTIKESCTPLQTVSKKLKS